MDQALAFIRKFIDFEYQAVALIYTERSDQIVEAKLDELASYFAMGALPDVYRQPNNDEEYFAKGREALESISPRALFQVKQYEHPELGELYRCYVSHYMHPANWAVYNANLYVVHSNNILRIVSKYTICTTCSGTDQVDGAVCPDCELDGWNHSNGIEFDELGLLKDVLKLRAPDDPAQLTEYNRE